MAECWGDDEYDQSNPSPGLYLAVSAGMRHSCALSPLGTRCWGRRDERPLDVFTPPASGGVTDLSSGGESDTTPPPAPTGTFTAVSAGDDHVCGLRSTGAVHCWGRDNHRQVSDAPSGTYMAVAAGRDHACTIKSDGTIACWGRNTNGQAPAARLP